MSTVIYDCLSTLYPFTNNVVDKKVCFVVDYSGSTFTPFDSTLSVAQKENDIVGKFMLSYRNTYNYYGFGSTFENYKVITSAAQLKIPSLGGTDTDRPLQDILTNIDTYKPDHIIIVTDGQTNASTRLETISKSLTDKGVLIDVIAVSTGNANIETIDISSGNYLAGMDLINRLKNDINSLKIYNRYHLNSPYDCISNTSVKVGRLSFLGYRVGLEGETIPEIIYNILDHVVENKANINWGKDDIDFKKFLTELGKFISSIMIDYDESHMFVIQIMNKLTMIKPDFNHYEFIKYGFECSKQNKPVLYSSFLDNVKESTVKRDEFRNAVAVLNEKGTTFGLKNRICLPLNGLCVIDNGMLTLNKFLAYENSMDSCENVYFGIGADEQAIRIALRTLCGNLGIPNAQHSQSVPFFVLNEMSKMFVYGENMTTPHMQELRKLAIAQTSMEVMISRNQYDGKGCYYYWQNGSMIPLHFSSQNTHISLYVDELINPFKLNQPMWWCLMMTMLGLFNEQLDYYRNALDILSIAPTEEAFLNYMRNTYKKYLTGKLVTTAISGEKKQSIFTLGVFEPTDKVYSLKDHGVCRTRTWYSKDELDYYVMEKGCVWCKFKPTMDDFVEVFQDDYNKRLVDLQKTASKLSVSTGVPSLHSKVMISSKDKSKPKGKVYCGVLYLEGMHGSGKTSAAKILSKIGNEMGFYTLVITTDIWKNKKMTPAQINIEIYKSVNTFVAKHMAEKKLIIIDSDQTIEYDFSAFDELYYYPNLIVRNFDDYQCWCLRNLLTRGARTSTSTYYLNPKDDSLLACLKSHLYYKKKCEEYIGTRFKGRRTYIDTADNIDAILGKIKYNADRYEQSLKTYQLEDECRGFMKDFF